MSTVKITLANGEKFFEVAEAESHEEIFRTLFPLATRLRFSNHPSGATLVTRQGKRVALITPDLTAAANPL